ncbi:MAG: sugar phosphate isomerase/epimerase family protein [Maioricimonas sp. JB049]
MPHTQAFGSTRRSPRSSTTCDAAAAQWTARLAISQMTTYRWTLQQDLRHYHQVGCTRFAAWLRKIHDTGIEPAIQKIRDSQLQVASLTWAGGFTGTNGYGFDEAVVDARRAIRIASRIGAPSLTIISGSQNGHIRSHARRLLIDGLVELADFAEMHSVRLALQPMHPIFAHEWTFLHSLDDTLDILRRFDPRQVGMAFGSYHLWQEPHLLRRIPELAPWIASVQLSDWRQSPRCDNDRVLPGDGCIPLEGIIATLEHSGYRGSYELEIWSRDLWKADYTGLMRKCTNWFRGVRGTRRPEVTEQNWA